MSARITVKTVSPGYWRAVIDNPPINLYDPEMFADLRLLQARMADDPSLRVLVFESADPDYFCAHYDVVRGREMPDVPGIAPFTAWPNWVAGLVQSSVITIAKVRGRARGHGSELALACDMRFASLETAVFAQIEAGMGVVPGGGATEWLVRLAGRSRALEILAGADDFDAATAERYGWINRALPDAELDAFVDRLATRIAAFDGPVVELIKRSVNCRSGPPSEADLWATNHDFLGTAARPEAAATVAVLMGRGLQTRSDLERDLGRDIAG